MNVKPGKTRLHPVKPDKTSSSPGRIDENNKNEIIAMAESERLVQWKPSEPLMKLGSRPEGNQRRNNEKTG